MHAIKGGWVGQTFALAKNNESEGRKSRIRRSKEERKEMVEAFIKKYQILHNGSFPSLNLTHKEVGGSFYTVREIVRDVIQENRVLGPAKFVAEDQTIDQFLERNPLGSIAAEPQNALSEASNDSQFANNQNQGTVQEMVLASDGHSFTLEHQILDHGRAINGTAAEVNSKEVESKELQVTVPVETEKKVAEESVVSDGNCICHEYQMFDNGGQVDQEDKQTEELTCAEHRTSVPLEVEKNVEEVLAISRSKVTSIEADVIVETFPLTPVTRTTESLDGKVELGNFGISTEDKGTKGMGLATGVDSTLLDTVYSVNSLVDDKVVVKSPLVGNKSSSVNEEALEIVRDPSLETSNRSTLEGNIIHEKGSTDLKVKAPGNDVPISESFEQIEGTAGAKIMKAPDTKNLNGTSVCDGLSQTKEVLVIEDEVGVHSSAGLQKGSNTLDRISLESWQKASRNSTNREGKSLWAVFKEYIDAIVKFWSNEL
ncbi:hypothetical protein RchiOBHm_Chr1g0336511 [Rosa chinensis]|uniref:AT3G52170-like helix-turn-helix domain-containing protein n=1 Tax=Rosa chinensis TaxID=74649 RepID=A0A2P6SCP8_ROSCH|nr:uncharacterized protein LOC112193508 [Rosa chinensis]PRQ56446.1 hypothetical protein RchiOBHm_Chr1g0336511 [Rosa chinensis]